MTHPNRLRRLLPSFRVLARISSNRRRNRQRRKRSHILRFETNKKPAQQKAMTMSCRVQLLLIIIATIGAVVLRDAEAKQSSALLRIVAMTDRINDARLLPFESNPLLRQGNRNAQHVDVDDDLAAAFDDVILNTAMSTNATIDDLCFWLSIQVRQLYFGAPYCACDANTSSIRCFSTSPEAIDSAPNLRVSTNTTAFYNESSSSNQTNTTAAGRIPAMDAARICFEYHYFVNASDPYVPPIPDPYVPLPGGCLDVTTTGIGNRTTAVSCSATLTALNGTMETCASCLPCSNSSLAVEIDCSNVNELAERKCYPLDGQVEHILFLELLPYSGASSIGAKLGLGLLLLHTALLMRSIL